MHKIASLIEICKLNGVDPQVSLSYVLPSSLIVPRRESHGITPAFIF
ncbi:MAG: transposase domain-containing protein [Methylocella sp.]